jgi:hypothetical protein
MKRFIATLLALSLPVCGFAEEAGKRESVEELINLMQMDSIVDSMYTQMEPIAQDMAQNLGIEPSEQKYFEKFMSQYVALMKEEMSWEKMKEPMIDIYQKNFTENEIQDMVAFYKSETGRSVIRKMPAVIEDSVGMSQSILKSFYPKLQALSGGMKEEMAADRKKRQRDLEQQDTF